jgi:hypothetical protein
VTAVSVTDERIEVAFEDELLRMKHEGVGKLIQLPLDLLLYQVYRRGYIRGHSARSREVQQAEEQARRAGEYPQHLSIKYEGDTLILDGRPVQPERGVRSQES